MTHEPERDKRIRRLLDRLAEELIQRILETYETVQEGKVMTVGPPPYRRLDCDGRALAYIRSRPRKISVRMDVSGLWLTTFKSPLQVPSASGVAILIRSYKDLDEAVAFLGKIIKATHDAEKRVA